MGEVISKSASRDKIMEDVRATATQAAARGGPWTAAPERLGPVIHLWDATTARHMAARSAVGPLSAGVMASNETADDVVRTVADEIWNLLGRPANDPVYELLFPGGVGVYVDGKESDQPLVMELLAELLESGLHPKLAATAAGFAGRIRAAASALEAACDAEAKPVKRFRLVDRMLTSVARVAHIELAKLKRYLKSEGMSEADIHAVIPDRPRSYGVPAKDPTPVEPVDPG